MWRAVCSICLKNTNSDVPARSDSKAWVNCLPWAWNSWCFVLKQAVIANEEIHVTLVCDLILFIYFFCHMLFIVSMYLDQGPYPSWEGTGLAFLTVINRHVAYTAYLHLRIVLSSDEHLQFFDSFTSLSSILFDSVIFTARCYASAVLAMGLCPSVTSQCSTKTAKRTITQTTPHDTPGTLVFWCQRSPRNATRVTPYGGTKCRWGGSKSATFGK